jgi:hypothetical protein
MWNRFSGIVWILTERFLPVPYASVEWRLSLISMDTSPRISENRSRRPQTHFLRLLLAFLTTLLFVCPSHAKGAAIVFVNGNYPDDTLNYALVDLGVHLMSWFEGCHSQTQPPAKLTGQVEKVKLPGPETQKLLLGPRTTKKISAVGLARKFGIRVPGASPSSKSFTLPTEKAARLTPLDQRGGTRKPRGRFSLNGVSRVRA